MRRAVLRFVNRLNQSLHIPHKRRSGLVRLAGKLAVDLVEATGAWLKKNIEEYAVEKTWGSRRKCTEL